MDLIKKRKADENGNSYAPLGAVDSIAGNFSLSRDDVNKILESLTHEQFLPILNAAVLRHPDVLEDVRAVADADVHKRKLFVRGLGWETNTDKLKAVFSAYGEIEEGIVITDKNTGKSKGYGFVTLRHIDGAVMALKEPNKKIDGRITVTQLASGGSSNSADIASRKIYVGNIPFEISSDRLLSYFSNFGEIEEGPLGFDNQAGKTKGFAFFVYKTEDGARASLAEQFKIIDGYQVICKLATDNKKVRQTPNMGSGGMTGMQNSGPVGMPGDGNYGVQGGGGYGYGGPYQGGGMAPGMQQQPPPQQPPMIGQASHLNTGSGGPAGSGGYGGPGGPGYNVSGYGQQTGTPYGSTGAGGGGADYGGTGGLNNAGGGYRGMPNSMPSSTGYDGQNYGMTSTYPSQFNQPGAGPRPPSGPYQGMGSYY